ncbi:MAG: replication-associated recombination protein A, partial [Verrucomicrobiia bacterium]
GMADPQALVVASAAQQTVEFVGMPEAQLPLAQAAIYIATAPKSNASAMGIWTAMADVEKGRTLDVPDHLKDTHYKGAERLGHGVGYQYAHDHEGGIAPQQHMPEKRSYYNPTDRGFEREVQRRLAEWRAKLQTRKTT